MCWSSILPEAFLTRHSPAHRQGMEVRIGLFACLVRAKQRASALPGQPWGIIPAVPGLDHRVESVLEGELQ